MEIRSTSQALEEWQRLAGMFPGLIALAQDMIEISSIEVAADAAEKRLSIANASLTAARQKLVDIENECTERVQTVNTQIALKLQEGAADAKRVHDDALAEVDKLQVLAQTNVDTARTEAERIVLVAKNAAAAIENRTATAKENLETLEGEIVEAQAALDAARNSMQEIENAKSALAAKLG